MKEWLYLAFFPQEDPRRLRRRRKKLTPFLKAVMIALFSELKNPSLTRDRKQALFDSILQSVPTGRSASNLVARRSQASDTLELEFDELLNLQ